MARGGQNQAKQTYNSASSVFSGSNANANNLYKTLFPTLSGEATNPQGYSPRDLAAMNTASQQSVGGSTAGAVGEGNLAAARTRNAGAFAPALDEAARAGGRQLSENALATQTANANLKQKQQQEGIAGLGDLYGENSKDLLAALGLEDQATQTGTQAGQSGWFQDLLGLGNTVANIGSAFKKK